MIYAVHLPASRNSSIQELRELNSAKSMVGVSLEYLFPTEWLHACHPYTGACHHHFDVLPFWCSQYVRIYNQPPHPYINQWGSICHWLLPVLLWLATKSCPTPLLSCNPSPSFLHSCIVTEAFSFTLTIAYYHCHHFILNWHGHIKVMQSLNGSQWNFWAMDIAKN